MSGQDRLQRLVQERVATYDELRRAAQTEGVDPGKLKAEANIAVSIARDMAKATNSPLKFHTQVSDLLGQLGRVFDKANNPKLGKMLRATSDQVAKHGEAFRHGDSWESA